MGVEDAGCRLPLCLGLLCKYVNIAQRMLQRTRPAELDDAAGYAIPTTRGRRGTPTVPGGRVETHRMRLPYGESQRTVSLVVEKFLNGFLGAWRESNTLKVPVPQCASGRTDNGHAVRQGKTGQTPQHKHSLRHGTDTEASGFLPMRGLPRSQAYDRDVETPGCT